MVEPGMLVADRYRLVDEESRYADGSRWRALDTVLNRPVSVRCGIEQRGRLPGFIDRLRANLRAAATVSHPGVVGVLDFGEDATLGLYVVMEHQEGQPLRLLLARTGPLTPQQAMTMLADVADALSALHAVGFVHRRINPGTVWMRPDGQAFLDGLELAASDPEALTGMSSGAARYISPDEAKGNPHTPLSDIYCLGLVAYAALSGRPPFDDDHPLTVAMMQVRDEPPPLPSDIPGPVRAVVARALAKDPADRWLSASALAAAARDLTG